MCFFGRIVIAQRLSSNYQPQYYSSGGGFVGSGNINSGAQTYSQNNNYNSPNQYGNEASSENYPTLPDPYQYQYAAEDKNGSQWTHEEQSDGQGVITGSYTINDAPYGYVRIVHYRADKDGFHVDIQSNEPGLVDSNPSQVNIKKFN